VEIRVFASASWASERVDLFTSTNPGSGAPAWRYVTSASPVRPGSQVLVATLPLDVAGSRAIRAHLTRPDPWDLAPVVCGTDQGVSVIDDQDDLVFQVAP
jgi:hypothetical protein